MEPIFARERRRADDPLIDVNILIQASLRFSNRFAIRFLNQNRGRLSFSRATKYEFLKGGRRYGGTQAELFRLAEQFDLTFIDRPDYKTIISEAHRLRQVFQTTGRKLKPMDSRQLATARLTGIDFATYDLLLFKRAKDLGIPVHLVDLFPGPGGLPSRSAQKAAAYSPQGV